MNKDKTCRSCLTEALKADDLYDFSLEVALDKDPVDPKNFEKISEIYRILLNIHIDPEAEETSKICSTCLGDLKFCYLFQRKCLDSEVVYQSEEFNAEEIKSEEFPEAYEMEEYVDEETTDGFEACQFSSVEGTEEDEEFEDAPLEVPTKEIKRETLKTSPNKNKKNEDISSSLYSPNSRFKCKKCPAKFESKDKARVHMASHSNEEKNFPCLTCPKTFKNRYQLVLHNRSHTGEKPFRCEICNRCFSISSNLQKHLDTHSSTKPYACEICDQSFKTMRSLKFHTVCYHQPDAKIKCPQCDKSFVNSSYLNMHLKYHTGEKNYTCSICNSKYYKSSHLKRHVQNVHFKLRMMKCDFCPSDFVRKETYRAHIISLHKRHLTEEEFKNAIEKMKNFQPPPLDVEKFTLEKLKPKGAVMLTEEEMIVEGTTEDSYYEENDIYDEQ